MRYSLKDGQPQEPVQVDVAIVGAGLAGLVLAQRLAADGISVAILESGSVRQDEEVHPLNRVEQVAQEYRGATEGRARCLGGTSTRWGGALLPYLGYDLQPHPCGWHQGWKLAPAELDEFLISIENDFGVASGGYEGGGDVRYLSSFEPRLPKWPQFKNRSIANIYRKQIDSDPNIRIWTDATVTDLRFGDGRVSGIVAESSAGRSIEVNAKHVAVAAGAIETTRLLLLFDRAQDQRLFPADSPLGRGFHDHLSASVARLHVTDRNALSRLFGFRFVPGGMRNLRFELSPGERAAKNLPAAIRLKKALSVATADSVAGSTRGTDGLCNRYHGSAANPRFQATG
jgi:choline dehydrogenase-like flavoprotein